MSTNSEPETLFETTPARSPAGLEPKPKPQKPRKSALERVQDLEASIKRMQDYKRKVALQRAAVVGDVVIAAMENDELFKKQVTELLRRNVRSDADKAAIADILIGRQGL